MDTLPSSTQKLLVHHPFNHLLSGKFLFESIDEVKISSWFFENTFNRLYSSQSIAIKEITISFDLFVCIASPQNKRKQLFNIQLVKLFFNVHKSQNLKLVKPHRTFAATCYIVLLLILLWISFLFNNNWSASLKINHLHCEKLWFLKFLHKRSPFVKTSWIPLILPKHQICSPFFIAKLGQ